MGHYSVGHICTFIFLKALSMELDCGLMSVLVREEVGHSGGVSDPGKCRGVTESRSTCQDTLIMCHI